MFSAASPNSTSRLNGCKDVQIQTSETWGSEAQGSDINQSHGRDFLIVLSVRRITQGVSQMGANYRLHKAEVRTIRVAPPVHSHLEADCETISAG